MRRPVLISPRMFCCPNQLPAVGFRLLFYFKSAITLTLPYVLAVSEALLWQQSPASFRPEGISGLRNDDTQPDASEFLFVRTKNRDYFFSGIYSIR